MNRAPAISSAPRRPAQRGMTLLEMVLVLAIVVAMAGLLVPAMAERAEEAQSTTTRASMQQLRLTICAADGFWADAGRLPATLGELFVRPADLALYDPATRRGWRGPYLMHHGARYELNPGAGLTADYGATGDAVVADGWGRPIVIQHPPGSPLVPITDQPGYSRLVSAGPDGLLQTPPGLALPPLEQRGDDLVLFLQRADLP